MTTAPRIDLHAHSTCSDGTDTPAELVDKAAQSGLTVIALTDHDTTAGWAPAARAAEDHGIHLVRGVELSTTNEGSGQHLLGYAFDPATPALAEMLAGGVASRTRRLETQLARLNEHGMPITEADVHRHAPADGPVGKPAIADALVELEHVTRFEDGMALLKHGGVAYVGREKVDIEDAIRALTDAGGVAVIAHPWGRESRVSEERLAALKDLGLAGIEAAHFEHSEQDQDALRAIAANLGLVWTGSSDYHGTRKENRLGCHLTPVDQYEQLLGRARR